MQSFHNYPFFNNKTSNKYKTMIAILCLRKDFFAFPDFIHISSHYSRCFFTHNRLQQQQQSPFINLTLLRYFLPACTHTTNTLILHHRPFHLFHLQFCKRKNRRNIFTFKSKIKLKKEHTKGSRITDRKKKLNYFKL